MLSPPLTVLQVLKENKYKKVCLVSDQNSDVFVSKQYRGHALEYSVANSEYAYDVLSFFYANFNDVALVPKPVSHESEVQTIYLKYLSQLPKASLLTRKTIPLAGEFFRKCYSLNSPDFFRSIKQSQAYNEEISSWIDSNRPMSIGLKGDLWQNLCVLNGRLIFADIDSAATEPLGFSEIIMRAEMSASFNIKHLAQVLTHTSMPICFEYLNRLEAEALLEIALLLVEERMYLLPRLARQLKMRLARRALQNQIGSYYG